MRVTLVSTHRSDRGHYAPLRRLLSEDMRFELVTDDPDVAVVLGDRVEMLDRAIDWVERRVPLVHIHGGEHTFGSLDERWRWAMTMLADKHCVATEEAKWEVDKHILGGAKRGFTDAYRTISLDSYVTGAPGLDGIAEREPFVDAPRIVVLYNPAIDAATTKLEVGAIGEALAEMPDVWWIQPNGDRFSELIPWTHEGLDHERFRDLLAAAQVIVGNSSAGIIEAPSLGTWTVNVGERQAGRPRAASVYDVRGDAYQIGSAVKMCTSTKLAADEIHNPYGDGHASERIRDVLLGMAQ